MAARLAEDTVATGPVQGYVAAVSAEKPDEFDVDLAVTRVAGPKNAVSTVQVAHSVAAIVSDLPSGAVARPPQRLGRYLLGDRLGIGGMAEVFLAEQEGAAGFKNRCVVKRMLPHLAEQKRFVDMFLREAKLASTLNHANIVQIWDLGEVDGTYFIAMEHVDGLGLNQLARTAWRNGTSLPMEVVCNALADAADGLAVAHARVDANGDPDPIIHRDISPDNLMIDKDGVTKILDFGIARSNDVERTATGELKGKVPFMSPEQLRSEPVDGRADVYALGVTAYWLLTGKRPFVAQSDLLVMQAILSEPLRPPRDINPSIPEGLNAVVMQMLEKDREQRIESAHAVAAALEHVRPTRRTIVAPFVRMILDLPIKANPDDPASSPSGFLPATPHTDSFSVNWRRMGALAFPESVASPPSPSPSPSPDPPVQVPPATTEVDPVPTTRSPMMLGIVGAVAAALVVGVLAWPQSPEMVAVARPPPVAVPLVVAPLAVAPPAAAPVPVAEPVAEPVAAPAPAPVVVKAPAKLDVVVRGPDRIQWLSDGQVVGSGSRTLKLPPGTRSLVAFDKVRGARTTVAVDGSAIDYEALPHGQIQPRAKPYADVFLGDEALGTTPLQPIDVVAGSYTMRFVYKGKEVSKPVQVGQGAISRPAVDFTVEP